MKIVLIRPPDPRGGVSILSHAAPMNLGYLAAFFIKKGYSVELWDYEAEQFFPESFISRIRDLRPAIIGFSCFTPTIVIGHKLARIVKENFPSIITIVGGPHSAAFPKGTLEEFPYFDLAAVGEGEETLLEVCRAAENNKGWQGIRGLVWRSRDGIKEEQRRILIENLDELPFPSRNLFNLNLKRKGHISRGISNRLRNTQIFTSRGCPFACIFCASKVINGLRVRLRSPENVLAEAEECLNKYHFNHIAIGDDTFTVNQDRAAKICQGLQKLGVKSWHCEGARVNTVSPELLKLMVKTGCKKIVFGVESGSSRILELIKKSITVEQVKNAFKWARQAGFKYIEGTFIIGSHPSETIQDVKETVDLIKEIKPDLIAVNWVVPYPGTEVYSLMKEGGYIFTEDWEKFVMLDRLPLWRTEHFTPEQLMDLQRKITRSFYLRPDYIIHMLSKIRNLEEARYWFKTGIEFIKWLIIKRLT